VDRALHISLGRSDKAPEHAVFKIVPVAGIPFYGYHEEEKLFLKIYLYNPFMSNRVIELLQGGAILNCPFQPHEAHIPYLLQFFIDYNLYGMSFIDLSAIKFRLPFISGEDQFCSSPLYSSDPLSSGLLDKGCRLWSEANIPKAMILPTTVTRQSVCELEVDAVAADILNRRQAGKGELVNPGLATIWDDERQRRRQKGESSQISPPSSLDRSPVDDFEIEENWKKELHQIIEKSRDRQSFRDGEDNPAQSPTVHEIENDETVSLLYASQVEIHSPQEKQEVISNDFVPREVCKEAVVNEDAVQHISELSQSQPAYSQRVDPETLRLLASLDQSLSASPAVSTIMDGSAIVESSQLNRSWGSSLDVSQVQQLLSQSLLDIDDGSVMPASGSAAANRMLGSQHIEELLGCGVNVDDEQELADIVNAVVDEEVEGLTMAQCAEPADDEEVGDISWSSSFEDAATAMIDDYEKPAITIPQLDGSKDVPSRKQSNTGTVNLYKRKRKSPVVAVNSNSPESENDFKLPNKKKHQKQSEAQIVTRSHSSSGSKSARMCSKPSQQSHFLIPVVKKLSQSDIEDVSSSFSCSSHSDETVLQSCVVEDVDPSSQEEPALAQVGAFESQEETSSLSSGAALHHVHSQRQPCLKFPGKEKCQFYRNSSFKYNMCDHPCNRAGDEAMFERFPGHGYSDNVNALSYLAFMSPPQSPLREQDWSPIRAAALMGDVSELDILGITNDSTRQNNVKSVGRTKRVPFKCNTDSLDKTAATAMHSAKRSLLWEDEKTTVQMKKSTSHEMWTPLKSPPTATQLLVTASHHGIPSCRHQAAYYSREEDVIAAREVGGLRLYVPSNKLFDLDTFNTKQHLLNESHVSSSDALNQWRIALVTGMESFSQDMFTALVHGHGRSLYSGFDAEIKSKDTNTRCSLIGDQMCIITPAKHPVSSEETRKWLGERQLIQQKGDQLVRSTVGQKAVAPATIQADNFAETPTDSTVPVPVQTNNVDNPSIDCLLSQPWTSQEASSVPAKHSTPVSKQTRQLASWPLNLTPVGEQPGSSASRICPVVCEEIEQKGVIEMKKKLPGHSPSGHSFLDGPTQNNSFGFKVSQHNIQSAKALHECQHLTQFSMEVHIRTQRDKRPDPEIDPICAIFYCVWHDLPQGSSLDHELVGVLVVDQEGPEPKCLHHCGLSGLSIDYHADEKELLNHLVQLIRKHDPDILLGYEVQMLSWGYVIQRSAVLNIDMQTQLSRIPDKSKDSRCPDDDEYSSRKTSEINIGGRIMLNVWRLMRREVTLNVYSLENVVYHVLHQRIPLFSFRKLTEWFDDKNRLYRWRTVQHYTRRCQATLQLLQQLDLIGQTSELARLFGILFYSVLSRGSQYRVESMMLRIAKPMNYIAVSPSPQQRARMNAPECLQLIMEPESRFYTDPVLVLDFQSLYPSIIIAYNYCFSTCLGRVMCLAETGDFKFGATSLHVPLKVLKRLESHVTVSPNGIAFVKSTVRRGVLPRMLDEILQTRIMVKQSMKECKDDKTLYHMLNSRQLGLKLIANVTYGYTGANFSGRMPCIEVGDSIVRKARETLERAIQMVNSDPNWKARVVYGDTDSMFILLKGRSKEEAFSIGQDIARKVTAANPKPVKLKFEKVYLPCVLEAKKRYVGFMYESLSQVEPVYDAKGIETVRRDGCPAVVKMLEKSLKLLFSTRDVSRVKRYVQKQFLKIAEDRVPLQEFIFAKEYRGMSTYKPGACVPALEITKQLLATDPRAEPRVGERVPYVVVYGSPGLPLIKLVRRPEELLQDPSLRINSVYYITKQIIPPLDRVFSLIGVDVKSWYTELPKIQRSGLILQIHGKDTRKGTISQYFSTIECVVCGKLTHDHICHHCRGQPQTVLTVLGSKIRNAQRNFRNLQELCSHCVSWRDPNLSCVSLDCPNLYQLNRAMKRLTTANYLQDMQLTLGDT
jgi:DNA polymerase elongation subunit (family B)